MQLFAKAAISDTVVVSEIDRIAALPRRAPIDCSFESGTQAYSPRTQALVEIVTAKYALVRPPLSDGRPGCVCKEALGLPCISSLNAMQAWWLWELEKYEGAIGFAGTGSGKTITSLLSILAVADRKVGVLLAKPDQRLHYKRAWLRLRQHFKVPSLVFDNESTGEKFISPGMPVLHFIPYSKLSRPEATTLLHRIRPDFIVADELHKLAGESSTAARFRYFMGEYEEDVIFCGASGSALDKTIKAIGPLLGYSLGRRSPYPINPVDLEAWASVLDPVMIPDSQSTTAKRLYKVFGGIEVKEDIFGRGLKKTREGLKKRLMETPGIIATTVSSSPASLTIHARKVTIPTVVEEALSSVRGWTRPDGEELIEILERIECAKEVGCGFYFRWIYPHGEPPELIDEWFAKRKAWNKDLRLKMLEGKPYLDSRKLCEDAAIRAFMQPPYDGDLPKWTAAPWPEWRDIRDSVYHEERVVWLDDFLVKDAAAWAKHHIGIVWVLSTEFGERIAEEAGIPYHAGGPGAEARILAERGKTSIVVSLNAHREGRDGLQHYFSKQLFAEVPAGGGFWEQALARLCRTGQKADTVETWVYLHTQENRDAFRKAVSYAEFTESMTPNRQLLLSADLEFEV